MVSEDADGEELIRSCGICGKIMPIKWIEGWNYFSWEYTSFCPREDVPGIYADRQEWLRQACAKKFARAVDRYFPRVSSNYEREWL